eukprot:TRINITY_DN13773_c0_g1_i1.p1 TRINITY_DN13773_c0_g1~~TRINITY_DN13773_c0_g1_i1.p1  ORF type:complete len:344 (-),score=42.55 TRINITY_DN13773_c0_g1_i1:512-1543(-)
MPSGGSSSSKAEGATGSRRVGKTFLAGATSGILTSVLLQPLDVVRTHLQANAAKLSSNSAPASIPIIVKRILKQEGVRGLWRGSAPTILRVGLGAGLYFSLLDGVVGVLQKPWSSYSMTAGSPSSEKRVPRGKDGLSSTGLLLAGGFTRGVAAALLCPVTVVKTRMEYSTAQGAAKYPGTFSAIATIAQREGVRGLFKGLGVTLLRDAPYSALYLLMYNRSRAALQEHFLPLGAPQAYANFVAGAFSGAASTFLTHPPDVVRTRLQLVPGSRITAMQVCLQVLQTEGWHGFLRGVLPRVTKRALQQALTWTIFEELNQRIFSTSIWASQQKGEEKPAGVPKDG